MLGIIALTVACGTVLAYGVMNVQGNGSQARLVMIASKGLAAVFGVLSLRTAWRADDASTSTVAASLLWVMVSIAATFQGGNQEAGATPGSKPKQAGPPVSTSAAGVAKNRLAVFPAEVGRAATAGDLARLEELLYCQPNDLRGHLDGVLTAVHGDIERSKSQASTRGGPAHEPFDDYAVGRFLLSAKYAPEKAAQNIKDYIAWRHEISGGLQPPEEWLDTAAVLMPFEDRHGRPMVIIRVKYMDPKTVDMALFEQGFCATLDAVIQHCSAKRAAGEACLENPLDQYVCCIDTAGAGYSNFSLDAVKVMQRMATTRYAERVAKMYLLNSSFVVRTVWGTVKPLLLKRTQGNIIPVEPAKVNSTLRELLGDNADALLPSEYGGSAKPWPGPSEAKSLEDKAGALGAKAWIALGTAPAWATGEDHSQDNRPALARGASVRAAPRSGCFSWCKK